MVTSVLLVCEMLEKCQAKSSHKSKLHFNMGRMQMKATSFKKLPVAQ